MSDHRSDGLQRSSRNYATSRGQSEQRQQRHYYPTPFSQQLVSLFFFSLLFRIFQATQIVSFLSFFSSLGHKSINRASELLG